MFDQTLTQAINAFLDLDPESRHRVAKLQGKIVAIELLPFQFKFCCLFDGNHLKIESKTTLDPADKPLDDSNRDDKIPDTFIRGTPLQMLGIMMTKENRHRFFAEDVKIEGDAQIGQQVIELFDHMQIDWEEHLSQFIGDVPAHHAGQTLRKIKSWLDDATHSFIQNMNEYVHEEKQWLPAREALQDFFSEIDTIRMDVDRMEMRLNQLREQVK